MLVPNLKYVLLFVADPLKSGEFYEHILGLKPVEKAPTFVMFALPNEVMLGLWSSKTAEPVVTAQPGASEIVFTTDFVDELYEQWSTLGIPMAQPPTTMDFGRTFVALDPDGHRIRVCRISKGK